MDDTNNQEKKELVFRAVVYTSIVFALVLFLALRLSPKDGQDQPQDKNMDRCSVEGIELHGELMTYLPNHRDNDPDFNYDSVSSENIVGLIDSAKSNPRIHAILLEVDSGGGSPVAGEEIAVALKNAHKPTVALIRGMGASAAYWAASATDRIFASENSDVGSIGVTSSYLDKSEKDAKDGYRYVSLTSGQFKDTGSPDKPVTQADKNLMMRDVNIVFNNFVDAIAANRILPKEKVRALADGSTMLGEQALQNGLIDQIGGMPEVEAYLQKKTGVEPYVCWN